MSQWSGKSPEKKDSEISLSISGPLKMQINNCSKVIAQIRNSSKRLVIGILTKNLALNVSSALFFVGLAGSLKWWYKDQLLIALLKQNLPAVSEPQQKMSWETGEYVLQRQNFALQHRKRKCNDRSALQGEKLLRKRHASQETWFTDKEDTSVREKTFSRLFESNYTNLYGNHITIQGKPPWQKHAYQRFVGLFSEPIPAKNCFVTSQQPKGLLPSRTYLKEQPLQAKPVCGKEVAQRSNAESSSHLNNGLAAKTNVDLHTMHNASPMQISNGKQEDANRTSLVSIPIVGSPVGMERQGDSKQRLATTACTPEAFILASPSVSEGKQKKVGMQPFLRNQCNNNNNYKRKKYTSTTFDIFAIRSIHSKKMHGALPSFSEMGFKLPARSSYFLNEELPSHFLQPPVNAPFLAGGNQELLTCLKRPFISSLPTNFKTNAFSPPTQMNCGRACLPEVAVQNDLTKVEDHKPFKRGLEQALSKNSTRIGNNKQNTGNSKNKKLYSLVLGTKFVELHTILQNCKFLPLPSEFVNFFAISEGTQLDSTPGKSILVAWNPKSVTQQLENKMDAKFLWNSKKALDLASWKNKNTSTSSELATTACIPEAFILASPSVSFASKINSKQFASAEIAIQATKTWKKAFLSKIVGKLSYPLELTRTLTGWEPPSDSLILNSYLDEIPSKLESVFAPVLLDFSGTYNAMHNAQCALDSKLWASDPYPCTFAPKVHSPLYGNAGIGSETFSKKWQLFEVKQLLKNELQFLINTLPLSFVNKSTSKKDNDITTSTTMYPASASSFYNSIFCMESQQREGNADSLDAIDRKEKQTFQRTADVWNPHNLSLPNCVCLIPKEIGLETRLHMSAFGILPNVGKLNLSSNLQNRKEKLLQIIDSNSKQKIEPTLKIKDAIIAVQRMQCIHTDDGVSFSGLAVPTFAPLHFCTFAPKVHCALCTVHSMEMLAGKGQDDYQIMKESKLDLLAKIHPTPSSIPSFPKVDGLQCMMHNASSDSVPQRDKDSKNDKGKAMVANPSVSEDKQEVSSLLNVLPSEETQKTKRSAKSGENENLYHNKLLIASAELSKNKTLNSLFLLNNLGFTFNNLSSLDSPPVLLPIKNDASFWMWKPTKKKQKQKTTTFVSLLKLPSISKPFQILHDAYAKAGTSNVSTSLAVPYPYAWPSAKQGVAMQPLAWPKAMHRGQEVDRLLSLLPLEVQQCTNKTIFYFNPKSLTWEIFQQPALFWEFKENPSTISINAFQEKFRPVWKYFKKNRVNSWTNKMFFQQTKTSMAKINCLNPVDTGVNFAHKRSRLMSGYVYPDINSQSIRAHLYQWLAKNRTRVQGLDLPASSISIIEKACLSNIEILITPTTFLSFHDGQLLVENFSSIKEKKPDQKSRIQVHKKCKIYDVARTAFNEAFSSTYEPFSCQHSEALLIDPLHLQPKELSPFYEKLNHRIALFPGFSKPDEFVTTLSQLAKGDENVTKNFAEDREVLNKEERKKAIKQLPTNLKRVEQLSLDKFVTDCNPRKTAYDGIAVQRNKLTKDLQPAIPEENSFWGFSYLGAENPLTNRQCHFFGQKDLSTLDTNIFQRDYLRQLGKETIAQSNKKGFAEKLPAFERVKFLSFSKAVNSFFLKKRRYTYLLEKDDQWHLLFQEQLRTALEETRKNPSLTREETKMDTSSGIETPGLGRIKISAPLIMARFPKKVAKKYPPFLHRDCLPLDKMNVLRCIEDAKQAVCNVSNQGVKKREIKGLPIKRTSYEPLVPSIHFKQVMKEKVFELQHGASWCPFCYLESPCLPRFLHSSFQLAKPYDRYGNAEGEQALFALGLLENDASSCFAPQLLARIGNYLQSNSISFFNVASHGFLQEPLDTNSWAVICQWFFLVALLVWIEQMLLENVFPALSALEQILLGSTGIRLSHRTSVVRVTTPSTSNTPKFQNLAGIDGLLGELSELVLFLRGHKERFWKKKSSYGVILTGPPGTGKTFLVRALANEARVPVLILSAGTLISNKLNASKPSWSIRHAFRRAKQLAPCILFIDEIDALGKSRGKIVTDINEIVADTNLGASDLHQNKKTLNTAAFDMQNSLFRKTNAAFREKQDQYWTGEVGWPSVSRFLLNKWEHPLKSMILQESNEINRCSLSEEEISSFIGLESPYSNTLFQENKSGKETVGFLRNPTLHGTAMSNSKGQIGGRTTDSQERAKQSGLNNSKDLATLQEIGENNKRKFGPLTQLLVSMDGISNLSGVLIMGATNRPELLDSALTRPGRFERIIRVERPSEQKRIEILKLYSHNLGVQHKIPWHYLANRTKGLTAADLAVAMNYSSLRAIIQGSMHTIETIEYGLNSITR